MARQCLSLLIRKWPVSCSWLNLRSDALCVKFSRCKTTWFDQEDWPYGKQSWDQWSGQKRAPSWRYASVAKRTSGDTNGVISVSIHSTWRKLELITDGRTVSYSGYTPGTCNCRQVAPLNAKASQCASSNSKACQNSTGLRWQQISSQIITVLNQQERSLLPFWILFVSFFAHQTNGWQIGFVVGAQYVQVGQRLQHMWRTTAHHDAVGVHEGGSRRHWSMFQLLQETLQGRLLGR